MTTDTNVTERPDADDLIRRHLDRRSRRIVVPPDLRERVDRRHRQLRRRRTAGRATMAAATVAVFLAAGVVGYSNRADETVVAPAAGSVSEIVATLQAESGSDRDDGGYRVDCPELIVWLEPGIDTEAIIEIDAVLRARSDVEAVRYVDVVETYKEFRGYYADEPEILALVDPEDLPTSFVVKTDPATWSEFRASIGPLPGVNMVETCSQPRG